MRKDVQLSINKEVEKAINDFIDAGFETRNRVRLRSCTAWVTDYGYYKVLQSYGTIVAFIDTRTDTLYDILRKTYGYTNTSARHISKFEKDYCAGKWNCAERLTWREV